MICIYGRRNPAQKVKQNRAKFEGIPRRLLYMRDEIDLYSSVLRN